MSWLNKHGFIQLWGTIAKEQPFKLSSVRMTYVSFRFSNFLFWLKSLVSHLLNDYSQWDESLSDWHLCSSDPGEDLWPEKTKWLNFKDSISTENFYTRLLNARTHACARAHTHTHTHTHTRMHAHTQMYTHTHTLCYSLGKVSLSFDHSSLLHGWQSFTTDRLLTVLPITLATTKASTITTANARPDPTAMATIVVVLKPLLPLSPLFCSPELPSKAADCSLNSWFSDERYAKDRDPWSTCEQEWQTNQKIRDQRGNVEGVLERCEPSMCKSSVPMAIS